MIGRRILRRPTKAIRTTPFDLSLAPGERAIAMEYSRGRVRSFDARLCRF
jgi:hypothetical protein